MALRIKNKKDKTIPVDFVIDFSASMQWQINDVKQKTIEQLKTMLKEDRNYMVKLIFFSTRVQRVTTALLTNESLNSLFIPKILKEPLGDMTALYDAIGESLSTHLEVNDEDYSALVYIYTDGHENSSKNYSKYIIDEMIKNVATKGVAVVFATEGFSQMAQMQHNHFLNKFIVDSYKGTNSVFANVRSTYLAKADAGIIGTAKSLNND
jgi:uncharacterized protein YegL